ncbi:unnamed protein product [Closterium sp. NIES-65]|nr:unnamed protein product [Closterium sp. NIES-65]
MFHALSLLFRERDTAVKYFFPHPVIRPYTFSPRPSGLIIRSARTVALVAPSPPFALVPTVAFLSHIDPVPREALVPPSLPSFLPSPPFILSRSHPFSCRPSLPSLLPSLTFLLKSLASLSAARIPSLFTSSRSLHYSTLRAASALPNAHSPPPSPLPPPPPPPPQRTLSALPYAQIPPPPPLPTCSFHPSLRAVPPLPFAQFPLPIPHSHPPLAPFPLCLTSPSNIPFPFPPLLPSSICPTLPSILLLLPLPRPLYPTPIHHLYSPLLSPFPLVLPSHSPLAPPSLSPCPSIPLPTCPSLPFPPFPPLSGPPFPPCPSLRFPPCPSTAFPHVLPSVSPLVPPFLSPMSCPDPHALADFVSPAHQPNTPPLPVATPSIVLPSTLASPRFLFPSAKHCSHFPPCCFPTSPPNPLVIPSASHMPISLHIPLLASLNIPPHLTRLSPPLCSALIPTPLPFPPFECPPLSH